jgi:hypothetical protein
LAILLYCRIIDMVRLFCSPIPVGPEEEVFCLPMAITTCLLAARGGRDETEACDYSNTGYDLDPGHPHSRRIRIRNTAS